MVSAQFLLDSESSKHAEFLRMQPEDAAQPGARDAMSHTHQQHQGGSHD